MIVVVWWLLLVPIWSSSLRPKDSFSSQPKTALSKPAAPLLLKKPTFDDNTAKYSQFACNIQTILDYAMYATPSVNPSKMLACVSTSLIKSLLFFRSPM